MFSGTYREVPGSFNIKENTLAPKPGRYAAPWVKKGEKYDLDAIDPAYLERLKTFLAESSKRGIVVELSLFCPFYEESLWDVNPMNAKNNVNGVGAISLTGSLHAEASRPAREAEGADAADRPRVESI